MRKSSTCATLPSYPSENSIADSETRSSICSEFLSSEMDRIKDEDEESGHITDEDDCIRDEDDDSSDGHVSMNTFFSF